LRFEALNRLWDSVRETSHDFRASTDVFPLVDIEKLSATLDLKEKGAAAGRQNRPPPDAQSHDETEQRIVAWVEAEKKSSYQILEDQFGLIRQANASSVSDFKAEVASGVDELHGLRRKLKTAEDEMVDFKARHKLQRAAKVSSRAAWGFKVSLIVFLVLIEMVMNGSFLAKGSEQASLGA
jgi:hypothetical protein